MHERGIFTCSFLKSICLVSVGEETSKKKAEQISSCAENKDFYSFHSFNFQLVLQSYPRSSCELLENHVR